MPSGNAPRYSSLGDEFQSLAVAQFLPRVDAFVPRDNLNLAFPPQPQGAPSPLHLVMAARFCCRPRIWPPPQHINPLFVGFRLEPNPTTTKQFLTTEGLDYLRQHAPVGCRDQAVCDYLDSLGVPTILTGCVTLTLDRFDHFDAELAAKNSVLAIDLPDDIFALLPAAIRSSAIRCMQELSFTAPQTQHYRTTQARRRLQELASASLVITTRLHATLPCVAFGTPVVLVDNGGETQSRTAGLNGMFHSFRRSEAGFSERFGAFPWHSPPPNPGSDQRLTLAQRTTEMIRAWLSSSCQFRRKSSKS